MDEQLHAVVHGLVQGVSFRFYTMQEAKRLKLTGWVRNRPEGTVEVVAEGSRSALERLVAWLKRGSPAARVTNVDIEWRAAKHESTDFSVRYFYD